MGGKTKDDWSKWHREVDDFAKRETGGFAKDIQDLEAHIKRLQATCPKDAAGWPVGTALRVITTLQKDHFLFTQYLKQFKE